jgi:hypothetical protein
LRERLGVGTANRCGRGVNRVPQLTQRSLG